MDPFASVEHRSVEVDLLTDAFGVSGTVTTRFDRMSDLLNQVAGQQVIVEHATISEHADASATVSAPMATVLTSAIILFSAPGMTGESGVAMRIEKRRVKAQLAIPPIRVTGTIHVPVGSRPTDGVINSADRFIPMTDAVVASALYPNLARSYPVVAVSRELAQIILVADDENPDELLADVLDERTAEAWLRDESG